MVKEARKGQQKTGWPRTTMKSSLKSFDADRAIEIVEVRLQSDILNRWLDDITRTKLKGALVKAAAALLKDSQKESEEDQDRCLQISRRNIS